MTEITDVVPDWIELVVWVAIGIAAVIAAVYSVARVRQSITEWARSNVREVVAEETGPLQEALIRHMDDEIHLRESDAADRERRQAEHLEFRDEMRARMDSIEAAITRRWFRRRQPRRFP
jgi:hypothetical protein